MTQKDTLLEQYTKRIQYARKRAAAARSERNTKQIYQEHKDNSIIAAKLIERLGLGLTHTEIVAELKGYGFDRKRLESIILEYQRIAKKTRDYLGSFGQDPRKVFPKTLQDWRS